MQVLRIFIELVVFKERDVEVQMWNDNSSNGIIVVPGIHVRGWGWGNVLWGYSTWGWIQGKWLVFCPWNSAYISESPPMRLPKVVSTILCEDWKRGRIRGRLVAYAYIFARTWGRG
jgi:hypothetical protein